MVMMKKRIRYVIKNKKVYTYARYKVEEGHGHMRYSCEYTDEYVGWLKKICSNKDMQRDLYPHIVKKENNEDDS